MNLYKFFILVLVINASCLAQERAVRDTFYKNLDTVESNHKKFCVDSLKHPNRNIDSLVNALTKHEETLTAGILATVVFNDVDRMSSLNNKLQETQKTLMGLKIIQIHEHRKSKQENYKWGQIACLTTGISFCAGMFWQIGDENYKKSALIAFLSAGFFAGAYYCKRQQTRIQNLPEPTRAGIHQNENKSNKLNRVQAGMQPITLAQDSEFCEAIKKLHCANSLANHSKLPEIKDLKEKYITAVIQLKAVACDTRNIDAVLVLTDLLEEAQKGDQQ